MTCVQLSKNHPSCHAFLVTANEDSTLYIPPIARQMLNSPSMDLNPPLHYRHFLFPSPSTACGYVASILHPHLRPLPSATKHHHHYACLFISLVLPFFLYPCVSYSCCCRHTTEIISSNRTSPPTKSCGARFMPPSRVITPLLYDVHHIGGKLCFVDLRQHSYFFYMWVQYIPSFASKFRYLIHLATMLVSIVLC